MSKTKVASKNNPTAREQAKEYFYNNKKIKPVKLISNNITCLAAEYEGSGDLVLNKNQEVIPWVKLKNLIKSEKTN